MESKHIVSVDCLPRDDLVIVRSDLLQKDYRESLLNTSTIAGLMHVRVIEVVETIM